MTTPLVYTVPPASSGKGINFPFNLIGNYGDALKESGQKTLSFAAGNIYRYVQAADGNSMELFSLVETGSDTMTFTADGQTDTVIFTITPEVFARLESVETTIIDNPTPVTAAK